MTVVVIGTHRANISNVDELVYASIALMNMHYEQMR